MCLCLCIINTFLSVSRDMLCVFEGVFVHTSAVCVCVYMSCLYADSVFAFTVQCVCVYMSRLYADSVFTVQCVCVCLCSVCVCVCVCVYADSVFTVHTWTACVWGWSCGTSSSCWGRSWTPGPLPRWPSSPSHT